MNRALHHFLWLGRRFRNVLLPYALSWAALTAASWLMPVEAEGSVLFWMLPALLMCWAALVLADMQWADPGRGTDTFWRTRPVRWPQVWAAQVLFLMCFLAGPPILCWVANGLLMHNTGVQWAYATFDLLYILVPLFLLAGAASFSTGWYSFISSLLFLLLCLGGGWFLTGNRPGQGYFEVGTGNLLRVSDGIANALLWQLRASFGFAAMMSLAVLLIWAWGLRVSRPAWRMIFTGLVFVALPPVALRYLPVSSFPTPMILEADWTSPGGTLPAGAQDVGALFFRNLPPETLAIIEGNSGLLLRKNGVADGLDTAGWEPVFLIQQDTLPNFGTPRSILIEVADALLKSRLPVATRWYREGDPPGGPPRIVINEQEKAWYGRKPIPTSTPLNPVTGKLEGYLGGSLVSVVELVSVPLEAGASAAKNGMHVRIPEISADGEKLRISMELRTACGLYPVPPGGFHGTDTFLPYSSPVLYLPALPAALLMKNRINGGGFLSLQTRASLQSLDVTMPEEEVERGFRFTPETLKGARMILYGAASQGVFEVNLPAAPRTFLPKRLRENTDDAARLMSLPPDLSLRRLKAMGPRLIPLLLQHSWGENGPPADPEKFRVLEPEARLADYLPDLALTIKKDPRWMNTAWRTGLADKLGDPALSLLRDRRLPLPESLVAAAAARATPEDYRALHLHALQAVPMAKPDEDPSGVSPGTALWSRLRALPGYDWRGTVLTKWRRAFTESRSAAGLPLELRAAAALAGDSDALNLLLDTEPPPAPPEVAAMIEGLPAEESARPAWLRKHRGHFTWDVASGRYRVANP